ncbi:MAG: nodulation protein NfeD [Deinococcus-Thermus bacterium]|nr:nodulation protein NfeD [Deinococcota bacterium]
MRNAIVRGFFPRLAACVVLLATLTQAVAQDANAVWILPIDTEITPATAQFVSSRIERANEVRPLAILLRIDTPGGRVDSMQRIVDAVLNDARVPVLAVVENAFSAGALIAMAAEQLAMLPGASIGAALPITVGVGGANPVDEKFTSAVRGQFRSVAEARGRDGAVAEAMVDPAREIPGLSARGELVTLSADEAVDQNIADLVASDLPDALSAFGYGGVPTVTLERNLTERLGTWLAGPIVAGVLLILGIGGLVIEFFSPGFGIPGAIGIVALALFATSAFVATPAGILDVLLILGGVLLLALEAFVIPGFGVAGVLGMAAIIAAVIRIFQDDAVTVLATTAIGGGVLLGVLLWLLPNTGLGRRLTLSERIGGGKVAGAGAGAGDAGAAFVDPEQAKLVGDRSYLIGQIGTAMSDLRPAGVARFGDERVDVVSDGDYVAAGSRLRVLRAEGNRVVVRPLEDASPAPSPSEDG